MKGGARASRFETALSRLLTMRFYVELPVEEPANCL
jgi:hypothetical protein